MNNIANVGSGAVQAWLEGGRQAFMDISWFEDGYIIEDLHFCRKQGALIVLLQWVRCWMARQATFIFAKYHGYGKYNLKSLNLFR